MNIKYLFSKLIKKIQIPAIIDSNIDKTSKICSGSHINNCTIGKYSYVGNFTNTNYVTIGKFCSISDMCVIGGASHPLDWVSTSPVFNKNKNCMGINLGDHMYFPYSETIIGNDVWIGANVLIKGGISIADGAVIGTGSVVTKNIGPYEIWAGNPAKLIRKRFNDDVIEELLKVKWWDFEEEKLRQYSQYFNDVTKFIEEVKK